MMNTIEATIFGLVAIQALLQAKCTLYPGYQSDLETETRKFAAVHKVDPNQFPVRVSSLPWQFKLRLVLMCVLWKAQDTVNEHNRKITWRESDRVCRELTRVLDRCPENHKIIQKEVEGERGINQSGGQVKGDISGPGENGPGGAGVSD